MLEIGDEIVCIIKGKDLLTYGKVYKIIHVRKYPESDIYIYDDHGGGWWFGQSGSSEPWTMWFITLKEWNRNNTIDYLLNNPE